MPRALCLCLALAGLALAGLPAQAQNAATVTGRVVDARDGTPLPGATVIIEGTQLGAAAGADGAFSFVAPVTGPQTVRVSFTGYRTERRPVELAAGRTADLGTVRLAEDILRSEEVVVTGTGVPTERRRLGNTIATVEARDIQETGARSVDQALAGKVPGALVQQNSGSAAGGVSIRLRGTGTVLGSADPLYIVDGVIVDNSSPGLIDLGGGAQNRLVDLNPADIERIEVVKGAAAAALYGSRANNGVVQIFTRRGQTGTPRVTLQNTVSGSAVRKTLDVNRAAFSRPEGVAGRAPVERFDYQEDVFRPAAGTEQYLSIAGGQGGTNYFVSGGHFYNQGVVRGNDFQRVSARARIDQALNRAVSVSVGGGFTSSGGDEVPNGGLTSNYGALTGFIFGPNTVDIAPDPVTGVYPRGLTLANPREVIDRYDFRQRTNRLTGDVQLAFTPAERFRMDYTLGLDTYEQAATAFIPRGTTAPGFPLGFARRAERTNTLLNQDLRARYETTLGGVSSTTLVGGTVELDRFETVAAQGTDIPVGVETVAGAAVPAAPGETRSEQTVAGVFGQQTFGVAGRLFLTAAARVDASSAFAAESRWNFYPKLSAAYTLSDEPFFRDSPVSRSLPLVRLRASYGETGGITAIGPFQRFDRFSPVTFNNQPGFYPFLQRGNEGIRPERQRELEGGVDLALLGGRAGLELTVYDQRTTDLLLNRTLAPTSGSQNQLQNVGELTNRGVELLLRAQPVAARAATWSVTATFAANRNRVEGIEGEVLGFPDSFGGFTAAVNGQAIGVFYGSTFRRDAEGRILGQAVDRSGAVPAPLVRDGQPVLVPATRDANGYLIDADGNHVYGVAAPADVIGDPNPDWTGSLINEVEAGAFSFRLQLDASVGGDVLNFTRRLAALSAFGTLVDYQREIEGELPTGYNARVFSLFEHWVEDGTFVKVRELSLTYRVSPAALPFGMQGLRVTAYGRNLLSFDRYSGYDPEINVGGQRTGVRGFDFVETPIPRTFGLTLAATL